MKFYLAGPVGYVKPGTKWKAEMKSILRSKSHEVYDPIENDGKYPLVLEMNELKKEAKKHYSRIKEIMQEIFIDDCRYITDCDYVICYFIGKSYGTVSEQGIAYYLNKFLGKKVKTINIFHDDFYPDEWLLCCSDLVFFSIGELLEFIKKEL